MVKRRRWRCGELKDDDLIPHVSKRSPTSEAAASENRALLLFLPTVQVKRNLGGKASGGS